MRRATESDLRTWWGRWPESNVIIITGEVSGLVVIDIDPKHGGDESAREYPVMVEALAVETPIALTGGGGQHYLYQWPGFEIPNAAGVFPGVDFRGDHGYIVAPGSTHVSGRTYEWDTSAHPEDIPLAELPQTFRDALRSRDRYVVGQGNGGPAMRPAKVNIDGIIEGTIRVPEGQRNETMVRVVGSIVGTNPNESGMLEMALRVNARSFDPPMDEGEVTEIVRNIVKRELSKQRASAEALEFLHNTSRTLETNDLTPVDQLESARALWRTVGVEPVADWFAMLDGDTVSYVLVTPEDEVPLGTDLLDYTGIRRLLMNKAMILMPEAKRPAGWDRTALGLRYLAREEIVDNVRAGERVDAWFAMYAASYAPAEPDDIKARRDYISTQAVLANGDVWIWAASLLRTAQREDPSLTVRDLNRMLKRAGWERGSLADGNGGSISAWHRKWEKK